MQRITFIVLIIFTCIHAVGAQTVPKLKFHPLPSGISSNNVSAIIQDSRDFMWFGTANGLNKFDGYHYTIYEHDPTDSTTIVSTLINKIYEDKKGNLWICADGGGLSYFDQKSGKFSSYTRANANKQMSSNSVLSIYEDDDGLIWFTIENNPLTSFDPKTKQFKTYKHFLGKNEEETIRFIFTGDQKYLWLGTVGNGIARFDKKNEKFEYFTKKSIGLSEDFIRNFAVSSEKNKFWISYANQGLSLISIQDNQVKLEKSYPKGILTEGYIRVIYEDSKQRLWVGIENGGINILDIKTDSITVYKHQKDDPFSLKSNSPWVIYEDRFHNIWVGTFNQGVNVVYNQFYDKFEHYQQVDGLANNSVTSFQQDENDNIWITTDGGGISKWEKKSDRFTNYSQSSPAPFTLSGNAIISASKDKKDRIWFGTWTRGMNIYDFKSNSFKTIRADEGKSSYNTSFASTSGKNGLMYVLSWEDKLNVFDINTDKMLWSKNLIKEGLNYAQYIISDRQENIWIASRSGLGFIAKNQIKPDGVIKIFSTEEKAGTISDQSINVIFEDSKSNIWVGTVSGLNLYLPKTQTFKIYRKKDGLPHDHIKGIEEDLLGNLWVSTARGLSKFNIEKQTFENYFKEDGLQGDEFARAAIFRDNEGQILVGGSNGFNVFDPSKMRNNPYKPKVYIKGLKLFNKPVSNHDPNSPLKEHISFTEEITLDHKQSVFTIEFVALNYTHPEKNQYAYIMENFEKEWNYVEDKQEATYTNLPAGTYIFRVKASNNDGTWNDQGAALKIVILPPWWDTFWFKGLVLFLIILITVIGVRWRVNVIKKQNTILERRVAKRTEELKNKNKEVLQKSEELMEINGLLSEKQQEIVLQNEELHQQSEELMTQRDFLEQANIELSKTHQEINLQKEELEKKNRQIRQSINAALTIQEAILPYQDKMSRLLGEHFVLYRPKDTVSGDFYWMEKIDNQIIFIVADCTGHGVPGAFMTLIGNSLLDKLVRVLKITDPATILQRLHEDVYKALKQKYTGNNYGMDAIVLNIQNTDSDQTKVIFSGAKNPFYYIDPQKTDAVVRVRGSRKSIGGYQNEHISFENQEVKLNKGSFIYLATDGYIDQNNSKRKKIGENNYTKTLQEIAHLPLEEQKNILEKVLEEHMKGVEQRDDILLIGFKTPPTVLTTL